MSSLAALRYAFLLFTVLLLTLPTEMRADEGMWHLDALPLKLLKARHKFAPTPAWTTRLRRSVGRLSDNSGHGTAFFVSQDGLLLTNRHVVADVLAPLFAKKKIRSHTFFLAETPAREIRLPGAFLEVPVDDGAEDITERVNESIPPNSSESRADDIRVERGEAFRRLAVRAADRKGGRHTMEISKPLRGVRTLLHRYRLYDDIRVVFVPEAVVSGGSRETKSTSASYGAQLDMCVLRVYDKGRPLRSPNYLPWNTHGVRDEDFVGTCGFPGETNRHLTLAEMRFRREEELPKKHNENLSDLVTHLLEQAEEAEEIAAALRRPAAPKPSSRKSGDPKVLEEAAERYAHLESLLQDNREHLRDLAKQNRERSLLLDAHVLQSKLRQEKQARRGAPGLAQALDEIARLQQEVWTLQRDRWLTDPNLFSPSKLLDGAITVVELRKPSNQISVERYLEHRANYEKMFASARPDADWTSSNSLKEEIEHLTEVFPRLLSLLGPDHPRIVEILSHASQNPVAAWAGETVRNTIFRSRRARTRLLQSSSETISVSRDPLIRLAVAVADRQRALLEPYLLQRSRLNAAVREYFRMRQNLAHGDETLYPDADETQRFSFGRATRHKRAGFSAEQRRATQTMKPAAHSVGMLIAAIQEDDPDALPLSWRIALENKRLRPQTPLTFAATCDGTTGNSGGPVLDRSGTVVGIVYGGDNPQEEDALQYDATQRSIAVDGRAVLHLLRMVYDADDLADEIKNGRSNVAPARKSNRNRANARRLNTSERSRPLRPTTPKSRRAD